MCFEKYTPAQIGEEIAEQREKFYEMLGKPIGIGLPSQAMELKESWSMKEVLTIVYIVVDDVYKKLFGSQSYFR